MSNGRRAVVVALAALMAMLAVTATASAQKKIWNAATQRCMYAWSDGSVHPTPGCGPGANVKWNLHQWRDGTWRIQNVANRLCLDDSIEFGLRTFPCHPGSSPYSQHQSWWTNTGGGYAAIRNQKTGRCVDDSFPYGLRAFPCNGLWYQSFRFLW
jgi:Cytolethal distending toxin A/C domain